MTVLNSLGFPFFGKGMTSDCVHFFDHFFVSQISWHIAVVAASPPFSSSEGVLSTPGDFPAFRLRTASSASCLSTGRLLCGVLDISSVAIKLKRAARKTQKQEGEVQE